MRSTGPQPHALHEPHDDSRPLDDEALAVLAQLTDGCSGADLERFVVRARQEVLLATLRASSYGHRDRAQHDADSNAPGAFVHQLALEIWHAREPGGSATSVERAGGALRPALVHFIDRQTRERPSARVISALTGIPASTVARIRQQRERGLQEGPPLGGEEIETP